MKIGIMQPYFMPYIGYFQLIKAVDRYVVYDDVNYIRYGWANRNHILVNGAKHRFVLPIRDVSQNRKFNEHEYCGDFDKFLTLLRREYVNSDNYSSAYPLIERIMSFSDKNVARFNANSLKEICRYLGIETEILMSSEIAKDNSLKGSERVYDICKVIKGDIYINAIGGQHLHFKEEHKLHGIDLYFLETDFLPYPQPGQQEFVPGLSMIDVLMNNSVEGVNRLLDAYRLI